MKLMLHFDVTNGCWRVACPPLH